MKHLMRTSEIMWTAGWRPADRASKRQFLQKGQLLETGGLTMTRPCQDSLPSGRWAGPRWKGLGAGRRKRVTMRGLARKAGRRTNDGSAGTSRSSPGGHLAGRRAEIRACIADAVPDWARGGNRKSLAVDRPAHLAELRGDCNRGEQVLPGRSRAAARRVCKR